MEYIGAYEAKTHFSEIAKRAEAGESFVVTKHGRPVFDIVPHRTFDREQRRRAIEDIRRFRESLPPINTTIEEIIAMKHEGHRF